MVAPGDIACGELVLANCKTVAIDDYDLMMSHVRVKPGDIVLSRNQSFGIASYVANEEKFILGQDTVLIQEGQAKVEYLYLALRSQFVQRQIASLAMGSTFKRINLGKLCITPPDFVKENMLDSPLNMARLL
jgi:type I restriction enzyme S subunit